MVATQSFSVSRRALDLEDYIDIGRRHSGWIAGPTFFGMVVSICVAFMLPNQYTSTGAMEVQPPQVSDNVVPGATVTNGLTERIQQMETDILSRTELNTLIVDPKLQLYKDELKTKPTDDVINEMKANIHFNMLTLPGEAGRRGAAAFSISFTYSNRFKARDTVQALMTKFQDEDLSTQKQQQTAVKDFVGDELQRAKADLNQANDALTAFKQTNAGKLPDNAQVNLAREAASTAKIQSDNEQIFRDQSSITALETQRSQANGQLQFYDEEQAEMDEMGANPSSPVAKQNQDLVGLNKYIDDLTFKLQDLQKNYSDKYPDIKAMKSSLASYEARRDQLEAKLKKEAADEAAKPKDAVKKAPNLKEAQVRESVKEELIKIDAAEKQYNADIARLKAERDGYQRENDELNQALKASTDLEAPYEELKRNQAMYQTNYDDLERKQQLAEASRQVVERGVGENLQVLDVATLPIEPASPQRGKIIGAGFALSIFLGFAMAGVQEAKDTSLKNLKDVRAYTNLPVLCSIPLLENTMLVKRKRRLTYLAWSAAVIVGAVAVTGAVVYYRVHTLSS